MLSRYAAPVQYYTSSAQMDSSSKCPFLPDDVCHSQCTVRDSKCQAGSDRHSEKFTHYIFHRSHHAGQWFVDDWSCHIDGVNDNLMPMIHGCSGGIHGPLARVHRSSTRSSVLQGFEACAENCLRCGTVCVCQRELIQ